MLTLFLGISLTLNVVFIVGIIIYFKIKTFGLAKVQKEFAEKFYATDSEIDEAIGRM